MEDGKRTLAAKNRNLEEEKWKLGEENRNLKDEKWKLGEDLGVAREQLIEEQRKWEEEKNALIKVRMNIVGWGHSVVKYWVQ